MRFVLYEGSQDGRDHRLGVEVFGVVYDLAELATRVPALTGLPALPVPATIWEYHAYDSETKRRFDEVIGALSRLEPGQRADLIRHGVRRVSPVGRPTSLRCFSTFEGHERVMRQRLGGKVPPEWYGSPAFFFGNRTAIYGHGDEVPQPISFWLDYEIQVACVIGREGRNISAEEAGAYIAGFTILNDWCARDQEMHDLRAGYGPAKGRDFATSLGPTLVTPDELARYAVGEGAQCRYDLAMEVTINDHPVGGLSMSNLRETHFSFAQMIERASADATLYPGDVLASGAANYGSLLALGGDAALGRWLQAGDVVDLEVEGLGVLRNTIGDPGF